MTLPWASIVYSLFIKEPGRFQADANELFQALFPQPEEP